MTQHAPGASFFRPKLYIDLETYSVVNLKKAGVYAYAEHPSFLILMAAYALDDEPVQVAFGHDAILAIPGLLDPAVLKVAHNAPFERVCLSVINPELGGVGHYMAPELWRCIAALAAEHGFPRSLSGEARWVAPETPKDEAGAALIRWFCMPDRNGNRRLPEDHPEKWAEFVAYCVQDVETLRAVDRALPDWPSSAERELWNADQRINDRGLKIDTKLARAAAHAAVDNRVWQELEVSALTGIVNPGSNDQFLAWMRSVGFKVTNTQAETIEDLLSGSLPAEHRRVLELRQELALAASSKFHAALLGVSRDGRLRGQFRFFGAHTGRWAGGGMQPHNLPRLSFTWVNPETDEKEHDELGERTAILDLLLGFDTPSEILKKLVRPMIMGNPWLGIVDYAAIEARVIAWVAGELWALEAFEAGRDIYVETADRMSTPGNKLTRFQGKVAVLALGFNGGVNSLRAMGGEGTDDELQRLVNQWRRANPRIKDFWGEMGQAFQHGGTVGAGLVSVETDGRDRMVRLPSGRALTYHYCKWVYEDGKYGKQLQAYFRSPITGFPQRTYGGRLTENVVQAIARDLLGHALVEMDRHELPVVGHVHDEVITESSDFELVRKLMTTTPSWAAGLPVDGAGYVSKRYKKD